MDISDQVLIVQNPDGTIQIGTQPHLKNKKIMDCYNCRTKIVFEAGWTTLECANCKTINQVPGAPRHPKAIQCAICHGMAIVLPGQDLLIAHCQSCGAITGMM